MKYNDLLKNIKTPIFSLHDLVLSNLKVYPYQLTQWVKMGYLAKIKNGLYVIAEKEKEISNEVIAFNLYQPSYVSLEWALSKYGLIPEMVYNCTSITTKTTRMFTNKFGSFSFRNIKKDLFFGYKKIVAGGQAYLIAEPEKALFDYIYLNLGQIDNQADIEELRLNESAVKELNHKKIKAYFLAANNKKAMAIYELLKKVCLL
ncbi:MAG: hypothetical protein NTW06_05025 [Candidatus Falkowbacteria bacterium]|nr:hypothetical protein [Candidatus Falkowbacteria bacterium]